MKSFSTLLLGTVFLISAGTAHASATLQLGPKVEVARFQPKTDERLIYTHFLDLNIYDLSSKAKDPELIHRQLEVAQKKLDRCRIFIRKVNVERFPEASPEFRDWESIAFNNGTVSDWERSFFTRTEPDSAGVLWVDSLDWSKEVDAIIAVGYAEFLLEKPDFIPSSQADFYRRRMVGHAVIGEQAGEWTLIHEIGHAVFNLRHDEESPSNIMFPSRVKHAPEFSEAQCEQARSSQPRVRPFLDALREDSEQLLVQARERLKSASSRIKAAESKNAACWWVYEDAQNMQAKLNQVDFHLDSFGDFKNFPALRKAYVKMNDVSGMLYGLYEQSCAEGAGADPTPIVQSVLEVLEAP